ncbi:hypothetical protein ABH37_00405 [Mycobacterium haemophilum]|uniref:Uncharacterized protein n=1 Tax=Mycobacterium haemophilum TaxID=29311 RepID=A0A0I9UQC2_9MYCO|nr:hypothetical protein ABH39_00405 [Mycobacterium haemophilum]KLO38895.1 hypothetical protein ABH38_00405 [Mycobacterium haemophilum]KLO45314.1 hypothetical protein ABH37_00405 [Mycobacterium haemophilum]KLO56463.1 hypothetical protein ABH36_00405 [Mycobacterium haemophilum]
MISKIEKAAKRAELKFMLLREGANHTIYDLDGVMIPIARHREFGQRYAETIYKQCETKLGRGWWR